MLSLVVVIKRRDRIVQTRGLKDCVFTIREHCPPKSAPATTPRVHDTMAPLALSGGWSA